jgi:hypothetical protein
LIIYILLGSFALLAEIKKHFKVVNVLRKFMKRSCPEFYLFYLAKDLFCFFRIAPEIRRLSARFQFRYLNRFSINVKDASLTLPCVPGGHGSVLW